MTTMKNLFKVGGAVTLLVAFAVSTQQVFQSASTTDPMAFTLDRTWQALGPFPAGMRELPFGGIPASVASSYAELLDPTLAANIHFSTYGPSNGTTTLRTFEAQEQRNGEGRVKQTLSVEYPDVDWAWIRKSAGWSSLQWQMLAATDLEIDQNNTALAITADKVAEFAVVPTATFLRNATASHGPSGKDAIEWHTGDWYSYVADFAKEDMTAPELPISHHLVHLNQGSYKLLVRSQYEIRIFGDPRNDGGAESPKKTISIDIAGRSLQNARQEDLLAVHTDPHHSNVPHVVGGWIAGWGLSFAIRNVDPDATYIVDSIALVDSNTRLAVELPNRLTIIPTQTVMVPVKIRQSSPLDSAIAYLDLSIVLFKSTDSGRSTITKNVRIPLIQKPAFWNASSSDDDHHAYMYSYLSDDGTVQMAAATPPRRTAASIAPGQSLPPLILTLHGAGVDIRDLFFSNSIRRQEENWVILPTGRTPWGYDWQLASLEAADAAVSAFHTHLYGLPTTMTDVEKQAWQFDHEKLFVMGHSNGGQGAWYRLSRYPDRAIGGMVGSAYTKVSDYVSFAWKVGRHYADPALQGILHSGVTMFENDLFASNLVGLDLLVKFGSADANVPPWNPQDMAMVVDGWNQRSGLVGKVKISEVAGQPHWWDTFFSEDDVQAAIDAACLSSRNANYKMPAAPQNFTLTVFNPAEAGSKGGWRISEVETPGRLAKLEVNYVAQHNGTNTDYFDVVAKNARRFELDLEVLRRPSNGATPFASLGNATTLRFRLNGLTLPTVVISNTDRLHFARSLGGEWKIATNDISTAVTQTARPIGPLLRIVTSRGPMLLVIPTQGRKAEVAAWTRIARRFAADLLLYAAINSQIIGDVDFASAAPNDSWKHSNIVTFGGPDVNTFTRSTFDNWPKKSPIQFPSPRTSAQFDIQDRSFYEHGTAMLTLAPHPTYTQGMTLVVHGIGVEGIARAARLLPTRTGTMLPEWIVVDATAEWMGEGGVQAAGWYDRAWGWSEKMSYVQ